MCRLHALTYIFRAKAPAFQGGAFLAAKRPGSYSDEFLSCCIKALFFMIPPHRPQGEWVGFRTPRSAFSAFPDKLHGHAGLMCILTLLEHASRVTAAIPGSIYHSASVFGMECVCVIFSVCLDVAPGMIRHMCHIAK